MRKFFYKMRMGKSWLKKKNPKGRTHKSDYIISTLYMRKHWKQNKKTIEELGQNTALYIIDQVLIYIIYKVFKSIGSLLTYRMISLVRSRPSQKQNQEKLFNLIYLYKKYKFKAKLRYYFHLARLAKQLW